MFGLAACNGCLWRSEGRACGAMLCAHVCELLVVDLQSLHMYTPTHMHILLRADALDVDVASACQDFAPDAQHASSLQSICAVSLIVVGWEPV